MFSGASAPPRRPPRGGDCCGGDAKRTNNQDDAGRALEPRHPLDGTEGESDGGQQEEQAAEAKQLLGGKTAGQTAHSTMLKDRQRCCGGGVGGGGTIPQGSLTITNLFLDGRLRQSKAWVMFLLVGSLFAPACLAQPLGQFPVLTAYNLNKQKVTLPGGLAGKLNLLLISFAPEQQKDVDSWLEAAQALQHTDFQFHYYELPVEGQENFIFRWWDTSSMRSDQNDPEIWPWIVPLFVNRGKLMRQLQIPNAKQVVTMLVDRQGHILWRASGPMTQEKRAALMAAAQ